MMLGSYWKTSAGVVSLSAFRLRESHIFPRDTTEPVKDMGPVVGLVGLVVLIPPSE